MKPLDRSLFSIAHGQYGLVTAAQLVAARCVGRARVAALESGSIVPVHRGVYRLGGTADSFEQRCMAALLAADGAVLSGVTAAQVWGLRKTVTDDVHILATRTIRLRDVVAHKTDLLSRADVVERRGLRLLRPARLLCDLAWQVDRTVLESVYEQMLDRGILSVSGARAAARRFIGPGRPGSVKLAEMLDSRPAALRPVDSDLELRLWRALDAFGLRFERQHEVVLGDGARVYLDLADPVARVAVEVDHVTWHGGRLDAQRDKRRDRQLQRQGWVVMRVTDEDIERRLYTTVREIAAVLTTRSNVA